MAQHPTTESGLKLIVGLGNPGVSYAQTRHNVGWLVLDGLARRLGGTWRRSGEADICEVRLGNEKVLLLKPLTYMNDSGRAVLPVVQFYKLEREDLLVIQDDLDSPFGLLRLKGKGSHGGQNGVRDLIRLLGHDQFARLKIGISRPPAGWKVSDWVLSRWQAEEEQTLSQLVELGVLAAELWATEGLVRAQLRYNSTDLRPKPPALTEPTETAPQHQAQEVGSEHS